MLNYSFCCQRWHKTLLDLGAGTFSQHCMCVNVNVSNIPDIPKYSNLKKINGKNPQQQIK